jgi:hypothetical protein
MSIAFYKMMNQPISETIYHLELLEELNKEIQPKDKKADRPEFTDNEFVRRDKK